MIDRIILLKIVGYSGHLVPVILLISVCFQYIISIYPFCNFSQISFCHLFQNHFCFRVFAIKERYYFLSCNFPIFFNKIKHYFVFFFMLTGVFLRAPFYKWYCPEFQCFLAVACDRTKTIRTKSPVSSG